MKSLIVAAIIFVSMFNFQTTVFGGAKMGANKESNQQKVVVVKEINDDESIDLSDGSRIFLLGIEKPPNAKRTVFLRNFLLGEKVICEKDSLSALDEYQYVYLWNGKISKIKEAIGKDHVEFQGFLNVKDGVWGPKKGLAIFINATLIKSGLAKTDTDQKFEYMQKFLDLQK